MIQSYVCVKCFDINVTKKIFEKILNKLRYSLNQLVYTDRKYLKCAHSILSTAIYLLERTNFLRLKFGRTSQFMVIDRSII